MWRGGTPKNKRRTVGRKGATKNGETSPPRMGNANELRVNGVRRTGRYREWRERAPYLFTPRRETNDNTAAVVAAALLINVFTTSPPLHRPYNDDKTAAVDKTYFPKRSDIRRRLCGSGGGGRCR